MDYILDYKIKEIIKVSNRKIIYRGISSSDSKSVLIKTFKGDYPSMKEIASLRHEYKILENLDIEGIVKPERLEKYENNLALVLEDFGGQSLHTLLAERKLSIMEFLIVAIQLAASLAGLHKNQIIHKDIKPSNILICPKTLQSKLADFSIATRLARETHSYIKQSDTTPSDEGTLAYISPEQTGRMNRAIDYRSDFYSLGVTLYKMATGQLPFKVTDPLELIHCHIACHPIEPHRLDPEIPEALSSVIMKLLAKNAEDRYQSAEGIKADLEYCQSQLRERGQILDFLPGSLDRRAQFLIPQKLYGRRAEVTALLGAFERASSGQTEMMLVSGYSGIGKSSLINEVHKPIVRQMGSFISGKFDQFKRNIPYAAIIQAFNSLIQHLLTQSEDRIAQWKENLCSRLGENGAVIAEVIPEIELIIGPQPGVPELGAIESENRFHKVFNDFVRVFSQPEHPLTIFLDDLQWADSASLKLIQLLLTNPDSQYLFLIGAYRDNEVSPTHPLIQTIEKIEKIKPIVNRIDLQPLEIDSVCQLVDDTLLSQSRSSRLLGELLFHKTGGNAFFLRMLLSTLHSEKLLTFDFNSGAWQWSIEQIQAVGILDDNVIDLIIRNLQKLPLSTQGVLKLAACIGNQFTLDVLATVNQKNFSDTAADLWPALQASMVLPLCDGYRIPLVLEQEIKEKDCFSVRYKFLHDRVQQAAYALIQDGEKKQTHLQIGFLLLNNTPADKIEENIFDIVNQLNIGIDKLSDRAQHIRLAELNLIAGRKAKLATAYGAARGYLNTGLELLAFSCWESNYALTLELHIEAQEVEYLNANFDRAEKLADLVLQQAQTLLEKVKVYETKIQYYIAQGQMQLAIDTALGILSQLGVYLPKKPSPLRLLLELASTKLTQGRKKVEALASLPEMKDPHKLAAMRILEAVIPAAYTGMSPVFPLALLKIVGFSLKYGFAPMSIMGYNGYGLIHCVFLGDINSGYRYSQLALTLLKRFNAREYKAQVYLVFNTFIRHWKEHIRETLEPLQEGIQSGLETGNIKDACFCGAHYCAYLFLSGEALPSVNQKQIHYVEMMLKYKQEVQTNEARIWTQVGLNLRATSSASFRLAGELFNAEEMLPSLVEAKNNSTIFMIYLAKSFLYYLSKDYKSSAQNASLAEKYAESSLGGAYIPFHKFYYSLALLALYPNASKSEQKRYLTIVKSHQKKMKQWADHAPDNYLHKYLLVEAEKARVLQKYELAIEHYSRAIEAARNAKYIQEEALCNELAAEFYSWRQEEHKSSKHLIDAYYGYMHWGAEAKVRDLEIKYPRIINQITGNNASLIHKEDQKKLGLSASLDRLDLQTILKASQAILSEVAIDKLLPKLMQILMQNTGAQKGLLFLPQENTLFLAALARVKPDREIVVSDEIVSEGTSWPQTLIDYIHRTKKTLVFNDITIEEIFNKDPYIALHQPKSILGLPLLAQGKLRGIVYLENRLVQGVFTSNRLDLLKVLTSQVSISIENVSLYKSLQHQAFYDPLTGLPNRRLFHQRLEDALLAERRSESSFSPKQVTGTAMNSSNLVAVMFLDLDRFKKINDTFGHGIADQLLRSFAERLKSCFRPSDTIARWGGDEFTVLLSQLESTEDLDKMGQRILDALKQPFVLEGHQIYVGTSIGIAINSQDGNDAATILKNADAALYRAKERGKNRFQFYSPTINSQAQQQLSLENYLHRALEHGELELHYQPQINLNTGEIVGVEALLRWQHPELGLVSPAKFIPIAEENGIIVQIGEWVLRSACAQNQAWQEAGLPPMKVAVNLSWQQFQQQNLLPMVERILWETGLQPAWLELEITENTVMSDFDLARQKMKELQSMGVYLSMDDFGTGYSSLSCLKELPFDSLKIDRSFVCRLGEDPRDLTILSSIISLGHGLHMRTIAEGVETQRQLELLRSLQCQEMQGYLFSRPLNVEDATKFLASRLREKVMSLRSNSELRSQKSEVLPHE